MTTRLLLALALISLSVPLTGQARYVAFESITVAATAIGFTAATINEGAGHAQADRAKCRLETAEVRYRVDGTAPTSSEGTLLYIGDILEISGHDLMGRFRAIRTGGTSGVLKCEYFAP